MLKLKQQLIDFLIRNGHQKSPEAEAQLIVFTAFRNRYPSLERFSELFDPKFEANYPMKKEIEDDAMKMAGLRIKGIPLQHITGNQYFFEHEYMVNEHVLIPRPETEILIHELISTVQKKWGYQSFRFAELGLGSGILSAEILFHFKKSIGIASEISHQSIALARMNLDRIVGAGNWEERFHIIEPSESYIGFEIFEEYRPVDLIVSNPPYVSVHDEIEKEVIQHEPHRALFPMLGDSHAGSGENPNYFYENFLMHHQQILKKDGIAFFEVPHERALAIEHQFKNAGFSSVSLIPDLTGRARVLKAQK